MSFRAPLMVVLVAAGACQLDDPVEPTPLAAKVAPQQVTSDSCESLGKSELTVPAVDGNYLLAGQRISVGVDADTISWHSTFGIDAVVVAGASTANAYVYPREQTSDRDLVAPRSAQREREPVVVLRFCYDWEVDVTVEVAASYSSRTRWSIERTRPNRRVVLARGQSVEVPYAVTASRQSVSDGSMSMVGAVKVANPSPVAAHITGFEATALGREIELHCGAVFPIEIAAGESIACTYSAVADVPRDGEVSVVAVTSGAVQSASGTARVLRESARAEGGDDCTEVRGHRGQILGEVCRGDRSARYEYSVPVGPYDCGRHRDDALGLDVEVACAGGCTRSSRYWQSTVHASAPGGDHAALGVELSSAQKNIEAGAAPDAAQPAIEAAAALLATYSPADISHEAIREQFTRITGQLRDYNTGKIGPGPCAE